MRLLALIALTSLIVTQPLLAQGSKQMTRYRWLDAQGNKHLSDEMPADAVRFGYDILNQYGRVVQHVDGAKTPEQLATAKALAEAERLAKKKQHAAEQLLATYPTEKALVKAQQSLINTTEQRIAATRINMKSQLDNLASLLDQAARQQQRNNKLPAYLQEQIDKQRDTIRTQREWIRKTSAELDASKIKFADTLKRYQAMEKR